MTIRTIDVSSSALQAGAQIRTNDGKLVTLKHVCVEAPQADTDPSSVSLRDLDLKPGQKARTRKGKLLTFQRLSSYSSSWPYIFLDEDGVEATYTPDGVYRSDFVQDLDDIEEVLPFEPAKVDLKDVKIGQKVRLKNGEIVALSTIINDQGSWPYRFKRSGGGVYSFTVDGFYYCRENPQELDIVEILPFEEPRLTLEDVAIGDTLHLRDGRVVKVTEVLAYNPENPEIGVAYAKGENCGGLWFLRSGESNLHEKGHEVVKIVKCPRVSIDHIYKGDILRLRNGRQYTFNGNIDTLADGFKRYRAKLERSSPETFPLMLWFDEDGSCVGLGVGFDVVEVVQRPKVSIADAVKGDIFRLRNGREFTYSGFESGGNLRATCDPSYEAGYLWFKPDGTCPNRDAGHEVVEVIQAPSLSIRDAQVGDTFVLRNGERVEVLQLSTTSGGNKQTTATRRDSYWFYDDGKRVNGDRNFDVVEWIPAPKPTLADRVFEQVSKVDLDTIEKVVISSSDYKKDFESVRRRLCGLGSIPLRHSEKIDSGKFEIRFK